MTDQEAMTQAIFVSRHGLQTGQSPFGAVIVRDGGIIAAAHNTVRIDNDPTAHAEINALRKAARSLKTYNLEGCTLYSTCEPCPMCLAATHWANVDVVHFGASIADAAEAGFRELPIPAETMVKLGNSKLLVKPGLMVEECKALFEEWKQVGSVNPY